MNTNNILIKDSISLNDKTILITGAAGFIGFHLVKTLLTTCINTVIIGIDNMNNYYDMDLKKWRQKMLDHYAKNSSCEWLFKKLSISDKNALNELFNIYHPQIIVNLAAQAGVRYSIQNPDAYMESNLIGFYNILESCRYAENLQHLVYASSSSVYGGNIKVPFSIEDRVDNPVSLYAATKKSNELLAYSYSKLYAIPSTGLRFFTVYGPAGRPDMAYFSFTEKLRAGKKISIFNYGNCKRDFTYIDDITNGIVKIMQGAPKRSTGDDGLPIPPYSIYNIGSGQPENLMDFIRILSDELIAVKILKDGFDINSHINLVPMQPGDVPVTYSDNTELECDYGYKPTTDLRTGLRNFAKWYKKYWIKD